MPEETTNIVIPATTTNLTGRKILGYSAGGFLLGYATIKGGTAVVNHFRKPQIEAQRLKNLSQDMMTLMQDPQFAAAVKAMGNQAGSGHGA